MPPSCFLSALRSIATASVVVLASCSDPDVPPTEAPAPHQPIAAFRVTGYQHHLDLKSGLLSTTLAVDVQAPGGDCLRLPSLLGAIAGAWNDAVGGPSHDGRFLQWCGAPIASGSLHVRSTVQLREETEPEMGVGFTRGLDAFGHRFTYLQSWLEKCPQFGPCDDRVGRQFTFDIEIEHDVDETVLCPGVRTTQSGSTRCVISDPPAPIYAALGVMANKAWVKTTLLSNANASVELYEVTGGQLAGAIDAQSLGDFIDWIIQLMGPLPYGRELRLVSAPLQWLGYEHPANIILNESLPSLQTPFANATAHTVMHEIAHQWAGNRTTMADGADVGWKEAVAEYLTYVFEDEHRPDGEAARTRAYWKQLGRFAGYWPRPTDVPRPPLSAILANAYGAGPMAMFVQLEPLIGRAAILRGLQSFLEKPGVKSVDDLQRALEEASGTNLRSYFDSWVRGSGEPMRPLIKVDVEEGQLRVRQVQEGPVLPCVVEIEVTGETKVARVAARFELDGEQREILVPMSLGEPVMWMEVDPDEKVMALVQRRPMNVVTEKVWHL